MYWKLEARLRACRRYQRLLHTRTVGSYKLLDELTAKFERVMKRRGL